jgi:hypothetical protein
MKEHAMKQYMKTISLGSLCVLLMAQLSGCSMSQGTQPSQTTTNQFLQQMQGHQLNAAYRLLSTPCKAATTAQQLKNYWDLVEKNRGKVQRWSQQGVQVFAGTGGSSVTLTYGLQCAKGVSSARFTCVDEGGKWLIQNFAFNA